MPFLIFSSLVVLGIELLPEGVRDVVIDFEHSTFLHISNEAS